MNKIKRYCIYRFILFLLIFFLIFIFREERKSLFPLFLLSSIFILDEIFVLSSQKNPNLFNLILDGLYLSLSVIFTGGAVSPFIPFYLLLIMLTAYMLEPVHSFIISGYSILSYGFISLFLREKIPGNLIMVALPELPGLETVLIEFVVFSFAFIFTSAFTSLIIQVFRRQLIRFKIDISDIVEAIEYGIVAVDEEGRIVWKNSKASKLLGVSLPRGERYLEVLPSPFNEAFEKILKKEEKQIELEVGGKIFTIRGNNFEDKGVIFTIKDSTEEKEIERKMQMREKLVTLGNFAANLAHEVRNPVSSIRASAELISPSKGKVNKNKKIKEVILKESDRLDYLVESFLDFAKSFDLESKEIQVYSLIENVIRDLKKSKYFNKNIKIQNKVGKEFKIKGDYNLLRSVFFNLGVNSLKAISKEGTVEFGVEENDKKVIFVKDTGCGIKEEDLNEIFSPFYSRFKEGFGFGLPIVKKILDLHNFDIEVKSKVGEGTEVKVII
ncbi:MAG: ATP-binding protein [candidate division WOR-3 bacterium]